MQQVDQDLLSIQEARILVETARDAHDLVKDYKQAYLDKMIDQLLNQFRFEIPQFAEAEIRETKLGCQKDKEIVLTQFLDVLQANISEQPCIGELAKDIDGKSLQVGVSLGVIPVVLPYENVVLNAIYSLVIGIKSGNAVLIVPHPKALQTTCRVVKKVKQICEASGLPKGCLNCLERVTPAGVQEIVGHQDVALILMIGDPSYLTANVSRKPIIYGSSGATPVFIEHSAPIKPAVEAILYSRSLDYGLLPGAEQYLIAEGEIATEVKSMMQQLGAHFLSQEEEVRLLQLLQPVDNHINPGCVGKSAVWLAKTAGFSVAEDTKVLVSEQQYFHAEDPFANEMKCPVMAFYLEPDWKHACEKSIQLLKEKNNGHTLAIHSQNTTVLNEFALKKPVGRMIVNAPASLASLGVNSNLPVSVILGGFTTGRGMSAKNITAADLTYVRQISYPNKQAPVTEEIDPHTDKQLLEKILRKVLENNSVK